jgi:hypothetical protein
MRNIIDTCVAKKEESWEMSTVCKIYPGDVYINIADFKNLRVHPFFKTKTLWD